MIYQYFTQILKSTEFVKRFIKHDNTTICRNSFKNRICIFHFTTDKYILHPAACYLKSLKILFELLTCPLIMTVFLQLSMGGDTLYLNTVGGSKTGLVTYLDTSTAAISS